MKSGYQNINPFTHPIQIVYPDGREETKFLDDFTHEGRMKYRITRLRKKKLPRGIQRARTLEGFINAVLSVSTKNPEKMRITIYSRTPQNI